jgi:hypothetical protein
MEYGDSGEILRSIYIQETSREYEEDLQFHNSRGNRRPLFAFEPCRSHVASKSNFCSQLLSHHTERNYSNSLRTLFHELHRKDVV